MHNEGEQHVPCPQRAPTVSDPLARLVTTRPKRCIYEFVERCEDQTAFMNCEREGGNGKVEQVEEGCEDMQAGAVDRGKAEKELFL